MVKICKVMARPTGSYNHEWDTSEHDVLCSKETCYKTYSEMCIFCIRMNDEVNNDN